MIRRIVPAMLALLALSAARPLLLAEPAPAGNDAAPADRASLEAGLSQKLSDARMSGFFTIEGQEGPPKPDEYTLGKVEKREGDKWLFNARIAYGKRAFRLPLEIPVLWAGDTAVITVSNFTIPGMGTFTARVLIHGDHYAGTWSSANHGGYMWGRIEHIPGKPSESGQHEESVPAGSSSSSQRQDSSK